MRGKKGIYMTYLIWILIGLMLIITLLALMEPLGTVLSPVISDLQCSNPRRGYRGACILINGGVLIFIGGVGFYIIKGLINKLIQ